MRPKKLKFRTATAYELERQRDSLRTRMHGEISGRQHVLTFIEAEVGKAFVKGADTEAAGLRRLAREVDKAMKARQIEQSTVIADFIPRIRAAEEFERKEKLRRKRRRNRA